MKLDYSQILLSSESQQQIDNLFEQTGNTCGSIKNIKHQNGEKCNCSNITRRDVGI